jgi:integrase
MPRRAKGITAALVGKAKPGRYGDGNGLYLTVRGPQAKFWSLRYVKAGRMREIGLGAACGRGAVLLSEARSKARELFDLHKSGIDPLADRARGRSIARSLDARAVTFEQAAANFIEAHRASWRNPIHAKQWETTLRVYAYPIIGKMLVADIDVSAVTEVLTPIWNSKPETASRVRGRIESILGREKALGHREKGDENPAAWKDNLDAILPKRSKVARVRHHAAMKYDEVGAFMAKLRGDDDTIARALEFCVVTCARTSEVLGARWGEIDLNERLWIIPPERMKGGREHRVPLSNRAIEILKQMQAVRLNSFVFPGRGEDAGLSAMVLLMRLRRMGYQHATVHGFRSCFRDWASERTNIANEVSEMALAHAVSDKVEAAYRRGDLLEKRFDLAEKWSAFCAQPPINDDSGNVVPMRGAK